MGKFVNPKEFYNRLKDKSKYKLVNGLFIVRYKGNGIYEFVADFHKKGSVYATPKRASVETYQKWSRPTLFHPGRRLKRTSLGVWVKLGIGFKMKPISEVLK